MVGSSLLKYASAVIHLDPDKLHSLPQRENTGVGRLRGLAVHPSELDTGSRSSITARWLSSWAVHKQAPYIAANECDKRLSFHKELSKGRM